MSRISDCWHGMVCSSTKVKLKLNMICLWNKMLSIVIYFRFNSNKTARSVSELKKYPSMTQKAKASFSLTSVRCFLTHLPTGCEISSLYVSLWCFVAAKIDSDLSATLNHFVLFSSIWMLNYFTILLFSRYLHSFDRSGNRIWQFI